MLLCGALAWTAYMLTQSLPYWPINPSISTRPLVQLPARSRPLHVGDAPGRDSLGRELPAGARVGRDRRQDPARLVGGVYAANTVGAIVGSVTASLLLVVWLGSQHAQQVLIVISAVSALLMLESAAAEAESKKSRFQFAGTLLLAAAMGGAVLLARTRPAGAGHARRLRPVRRHARSASPRSSTSAKGWNASVAVTRLSNGVLNYHNAGKVQASSEPQDMRLQRMLGHMTTLIPKNPETVLVIGCGAGVTAGAVSIDPAVKRLTIAEIEPLVPAVVSKLLRRAQLRRRRRTRRSTSCSTTRGIILLTTDEKFDAITSDPLDPWVKGAAMLYTKEFFETVKAHLNPGGVVTLFVQLYESNTAAVKSEIATFLEVFPGGVVWGNTNNGAGLRPRAARAGRADEDRRRGHAGAASASRRCAGGAVARRDRDELGGGSVLQLRRARRPIWRRGSPMR